MQPCHRCSPRSRASELDYRSLLYVFYDAPANLSTGDAGSGEQTIGKSCLKSLQVCDRSAERVECHLHGYIAFSFLEAQGAAHLHLRDAARACVGDKTSSTMPENDGELWSQLPSRTLPCRACPAFFIFHESDQERNIFLGERNTLTSGTSEERSRRSRRTSTTGVCLNPLSGSCDCSRSRYGRRIG